MKGNKTPFTWIVEEYAFGAIALKEEIERHKRDDKVRWSLCKAVGIRLFYVYCRVVTYILVGIGIVSNIYRERKENWRKK